MAKIPDVVHSASMLGESLHLSLPTVSKILKLLAEASLVQSVRGAKGGYRLKQTPENITLLQIMSAIEGPISLTECCHEYTRCAVSKHCVMKANWFKLNHHIIQLFERIRLCDMIQPLSLTDWVIARQTV
jgi:FeS assembly SUF system regulator